MPISKPLARAASRRVLAEGEGVGAFGAHARDAFCLGRDRSSLVGGTMTPMRSPTPNEPYICTIAPQFR